jgi:alcohol dehydrogenase
MLSVHLEAGCVGLRDVAMPARPPQFALIRMLCAGICNTDLELQRGYYGFTGTPGHEFVGEVVEADDRTLVGRRVVGEINLNCGSCEWCRRNLGRHCPHRTVLGIVKHPGAFQEFLTLPERNLHVLPDAIPTQAGVFIEPLAAACEILEQVQLPCSSQIAVLGDGKLGLLIAQALNAYGFVVRQFGRHPEKLRISEKAGVYTELATATLPTAAFDWVVDATGSADGLRQAVQMVRPRGTVILKSTQHGLVGVDTAPVIVNEITLVGSRCGRFEPALELLSRGLINVQDMISDCKKLADAPQAFEQAARKGTMKVLLT